MANEIATQLRSPLGRVRGLGSARGGTQHWWMQRITSAALLPLTLWFVLSVALLAGAGHEATIAWMARPWNATLLLLTIGLTFHHLAAGLQVIIEDYAKPEVAKMGGILAVKAICLVLALAAGLAVLRIAV
jgi:succinate dehydrogenase / fumarate reductase membrane anchor subunit